MAKYRARHCPQCNYYLGFSVTKSPGKNKETVITSFCLNCTYKLPINRIIRGIRRTTSPLRRAALRLASVTNRDQTTGSAAQRQVDAEWPFSPLDYPRHLRVIGQDLETLRLKTFNLECTGNAYFVWSPSGAVESEDHPISRISKNRLQKLWKKKSRLRAHGHEERFTLPSSLPTKRYRYSFRDIERMECYICNHPPPNATYTLSHTTLFR